MDRPENPTVPLVHETSRSTSSTTQQSSFTAFKLSYHRSSGSDLRSKPGLSGQIVSARRNRLDTVPQSLSKPENQPLSTLDCSTMTSCAECVTECNEPSCPAVEITSECTDRCVVIACSDPDHGDMSCHGTAEHARCGLACDGAAQCIDCTGFEEFLQCCTDYHSYSSEPRNHFGETLPADSWDQTLNAFLCGCAESERLEDPVNITTSPLLPPAIQYPPFPTTEIEPQAPSSTFTCMWGKCNATFTSLAGLVGHVNIQHLHLPPSPQTESQSLPYLPDNLSCLWRDCTLYPTPGSIPGSSSGPQADIIATHLFQDHLGLPSHNAFAFASNPVISGNPTNPFEKYTPPTAGRFPTPPESGPPTPPVPQHQCSGTHHVCAWQACGQTFTSCDTLTVHLAAAHVGVGKARYECFWDGCARHGEHGFSSKQKICRHLQSHTGHRPFQCDTCKQNFSEAATLQQHMRRHTREKPYTCDFPGCGKAFAITGALTIHKRTHNGHKPFKCSYCERAFAESSNLSKHLRTHTGARPYVCAEDGCCKAFARPDQLTRHASVHRKKTSGVESSLI